MWPGPYTVPRPTRVVLNAPILSSSTEQGWRWFRRERICCQGDTPLFTHCDCSMEKERTTERDVIGRVIKVKTSARVVSRWRWSMDSLWQYLRMLWNGRIMPRCYDGTGFRYDSNVVDGPAALVMLSLVIRPYYRLHVFPGFPWLENLCDCNISQSNFLTVNPRRLLLYGNVTLFAFFLSSKSSYTIELE